MMWALPTPRRRQFDDVFQFRNHAAGRASLLHGDSASSAVRRESFVPVAARN